MKFFKSATTPERRITYRRYAIGDYYTRKSAATYESILFFYNEKSYT